MYGYEQIWEDCMAGHGLIDMACQQRETNYSLVSHHASLVTLSTAVLVFNMKSVKIMSLFDHNVGISMSGDRYLQTYCVNYNIHSFTFREWEHSSKN